MTSDLNRSASTKSSPEAARPGEPDFESFKSVLERRHVDFVRGETDTLQVNVGLACNQSCRHCHLDAGPGRNEMMSRETVEEVIEFSRRCRFSTIDVTGGAPELLPDIHRLLEGLSPLTTRLIIRSNLTAAPEKREHLLGLCRDLGVALIASFPSMSESQSDAQRGSGVWKESIETLKKLNTFGYGEPGSGLDLNLVVNPAGAFLPPDQCRLEEKFRRDLKKKYGVLFNNLFTFANVPLGRFKRWLVASGNYDSYLKKLSDGFDSANLVGLQCRSLLSVSWEGCLYDCDFNQAAGMPLGGERSFISGCSTPPAAGTPIAVGDHCFACTAGPGFT